MVSLISGWGNSTLTNGIAKQTAPTQLSINSGTAVKTTQLYKANFPTNNVNTKLVGGVAIRPKGETKVEEQQYKGYTIRIETSSNGEQSVTIFMKGLSKECSSVDYAKGYIDILAENQK